MYWMHIREYEIDKAKMVREILTSSPETIEDIYSALSDSEAKKLTDEQLSEIARVAEECEDDKEIK